MTYSALPLQIPLFAEGGGAAAAQLTRAALYEAVDDRPRVDLGVYLGLATACRGPVLELGAGTGRLLAPLLAKGIDALGIERDPDALLVGRRRLEALGGAAFSRHLIEGDMTSLSLSRRFSLIVIARNALSLLVEPDALAAALDGARRHLAPGGALVFDVSRVEGHVWHRPPYTWRGEAEGVWVAGVAASIVESGSYDPRTRRCTVTRAFELADGRRAEARTERHQRSLDQLLGSVRAAGLEPTSSTDESGGPLSDASTRLFVTSKLAA